MPERDDAMVVAVRVTCQNCIDIRGRWIVRRRCVAFRYIDQFTVLDAPRVTNQREVEQARALRDEQGNGCDRKSLVRATSHYFASTSNVYAAVLLFRPVMSAALNPLAEFQP